MGLFDITLADSVQYCAKEAIRTVASQCSAWQNLCERSAPAEAAERIITSPHDLPWGGKNYTKEELDVRFCEAQIWAPSELTEFHVDTGNFDAEPYRNGTFAMRVRRIIRPNERDQGEAKLYNHLLAACDLLAQQMMQLANRSQAPRLQNINRTNPAYASFETEVAQGDFVHWLYMIPWGDLEEN